MNMLLRRALFPFFLFTFAGTVFSQDVYELRKLSDRDWVDMTTEERLNALNTSNNHASNQTFIGNFGTYYDQYPKWGYDYYEMEDRYENYAFRGFENYNIIEDRRQKWYYNQFGDRLTKMTSNAQIWYERANDDGSYSADGPGGYINQLVTADGIWVARESTDDWAVSAVGAGALRTKLTPLTLSMPNLTGMKVDFQSHNYQASLVSGILGGRLAYIPPHSGLIRGLESNSLMLRAGQIRRKIGDLMLGASYANMYSVQENREEGHSSKGMVSDYAPTPIYYLVRIIDDSPQDGGGPIVHNIRIKVNGQYRSDIIPQAYLDDLRREKITAVTGKAHQNYYETQSNFSGEIPPFDQTTVFDRIPKYLDYLYMNDYLKGWNTKTMTEDFNIKNGLSFYKVVNTGDLPLQVNGNEYVVFIFDLGSITDVVRRVEAEITVSNDYRIQVAEFNTKRGGHDSSGDNYSSYTPTFWKTMAQADGNIKDGSNMRTVSVDFGYEVANTIYGFDASFNYLGFKINGEYVTNIHHYMFSDGAPGTGIPPTEPLDWTPREGYRSTLTDHSYYVVAQKDWTRCGFGGELFKMGKFYRPNMMYYMPRDISGSGYNSRNDYVRMTLIDDNDDDDQYPDLMPIPKAMAVEMLSLLDPDGVFPGNDLDHDGLPDNEKNDNQIPDYDEPFLMFDVDPDEYVFGDDFNNNTIPDFRENDLKDDMPYDIDRAGRHLFLRFTPQQQLNLVVGSFRTRGVGLDNRTDNNYLKMTFNYNVLSIGNIYAEYRHERIKDNIQDQFVIVPTKYLWKATPWGQMSRYDLELYYDEVEFRNSDVNKFFLDSRIRPIPSLTIENHVRYERNYQIEGTMYDNTFQPKDILSTFAMVNKFVYTWQLGNFTFAPGVKFRFYKKERSESFNPLDHYLMRIPVVYLKYRISENTNITYGMQGFKGFEMLYRDYIQSHNDFHQVNHMIQIENRTNYFGFDTWAGFGFQLEQVSFDEEYRKFEEFKRSSFFLKMYIGY